jgi:photosystem II stability/assembly factor-like uncharacterized protein
MAQVTSPVPSPLPTVGPRYLDGTPSVSGTAAWVGIEGGVSVSADGGRTWSIPALPPGVAAADLLQVAGAAGRGFWLGVREDNGARLYESADGSSWSSVALVPHWPAAFQVSGPPELILIAPGPAELVAVAETIGVGTGSALTTLFVSRDNGLTFTERPPTWGSLANFYWHSIAFLDDHDAVVGTGAETGPAGLRTSADLIHSTDGGATWSATATSGLPSGGIRYFGVPAVAASDFVVSVVTSPCAGCSGSLWLLVSHDQGASFAVSGTSLSVGSAIEPVVATDGQTTWVVPSPGDATGSIYQTSDRGITWTSTPVPGPIVDLTLTGPTSAIAVIDAGTCDAAQSCGARTYLITTADGGRTWSAL